jgi:hypothetical protein
MFSNWITVAGTFLLSSIVIFMVSYLIGAGLTKGKMDVIYDMARKGQVKIMEDDRDE